MYNIKTFVSQQQNSKFKRTKLRKKVKESEFPRNMYIYTLCSKYFQSFMKFYSVVKAMNAMKTRLVLLQNKTAFIEKMSSRIEYHLLKCIAR